ncbi:MAG: polyribonucleotide nucleotidyltransferase [Candidatus Doudnabacteria bacterium]|nr:polyribonucleotide nucleotidyltransferase [Candidatus Doudnabacteria bacterium]
MLKPKTTQIELPEGTITLETGLWAPLAAGAVKLTMGGTTLFVTATVDNVESEQDFFPLSIEYVERMYASGMISSSRFLKREGSPNDSAVTKARQVDHSIRPLFPKGFRKPVLIVMTVLSYDGVHNPEALTVMGASVATMLAGVPFAGPASGAVVAVDKDGKLHINPSLKHKPEELLAEFSLAGTTGKVLNFEGWGKEVSEETMDEIMDLALERIAKLNEAQNDFVKGIAKETMEYKELPVKEEVLEYVEKEMKEEIKKAIYLFDREENGRQIALRSINEAVAEKLITEGSDISAFDIEMAVDYVGKKIMRAAVLAEDKRLSGRKLDEIRPLTAEVDLLPTVHGSAFFTRGLTQSLSIATLAPAKLNQIQEGLDGEYEKGFLHYYNMPSFATGEAKKFQYRPGRREIGHGTIGENALKYIVPDQKEFPYMIRVVSEILSSNGSTSMAAVCASSMALMAAGVPMKGAVAGIGVGLVTDSEDDSKYKLLLDIEGVEDFWGDMDFKVTGTSKGITAIQFETKLKGVKPEILKQAFRLSKQGRTQVLDVMSKAIAQSRAELAENAPRVDVVTVPVDMIGEIIGPGGKNIKALTEAGEAIAPGFKLEIDIEQDGRVMVFSANKEQRDYVVSKLQGATMAPEVGAIYEGMIDKVMPYGAFIDVSPQISGLIHVSELADGFVKDPNDVVKEGDIVKVKLTKIENGKQSFSIKQAQAKEGK